MPRRPTLFMRIHKTAGEALAKQISDRLPPDAVCPEQFEWRARALPLATLRQFSFFHGHMTPPTLSAAFPSLQVFTMLREPRERLLSCFFYWKAGARTMRNEFFDAIAPLSLPEFLRSDEPVIRRVTWNVQARLLAGGQFGGVDQLRQNVFGPWVRDRDLAGEAVRGMDRFAFIGITERYQASLQAAYTLLDLGQPPPPERINTTSERPVSYDALLETPDINDALRRLTEADQFVYDEACRRFDLRAGAAVGGERSGADGEAQPGATASPEHVKRSRVEPATLPRRHPAA